MRILMLTPYLPFPPHAGGRIRMLELLRFLKPRHEVTVVSFIFDEDEMQWVKALSVECNRVIPVMRTAHTHSDLHRPRLINEYRTREMEALSIQAS